MLGGWSGEPMPVRSEMCVRIQHIDQSEEASGPVRAPAQSAEAGGPPSRWHGMRRFFLTSQFAHPARCSPLVSSVPKRPKTVHTGRSPFPASKSPQAGRWKSPSMPGQYARKQIARRGAVARLRYEQ